MAFHRATTEMASIAYDSIVFNTNAFYNRPAPSPYVSFGVGGGLALVTLLYWYMCRWNTVRKAYAIKKAPRTLVLRTFISTWADNDDPVFTILRGTAQAMVLLGGFQWNYQLTFIVMICYYAVISFGDSLRVLLSLREVGSLEDLVVVSKRDQAKLAASLKAKKDGSSTIDLPTNNVYEDISQNFIVVLMVFITQVVLISFVSVDIYRADTMSTLDGTSNVPIVGTLGSWLVYCLGIFMQAVYILGPKTSFGTSEQNPHFWLLLLISAKKSGARCSWQDPIEDKERSRTLRSNDLMLWTRFFMSFLINGVGFHILVHALPIQVAGQRNLTGIVFRAVGMIYLVDLDDAPGTKLTVGEGRSPPFTGKSQDNDDSPPSSTEVVVESKTQELLAAAREKAEALHLQLEADLAELMKKHTTVDKGAYSV